MVIPIEYGYRPGEKLVGKGNFICPLCCRKRQYKRLKVVKEYFYGILSFPTKNIGEYIHCQSCLQSFSPKVLDSDFQLKVKIEEGTLPPANMMDIWKEIYVALNCEALIAYNTDIVEGVSPMLFTMASFMQDVGVKLRLQEYEEARKYLVAILKGGIQYQEFNIKNKAQPQIQTPKRHKKIMEHMEFSHVLLSRLP